MSHEITLEGAKETNADQIFRSAAVFSALDGINYNVSIQPGDIRYEFRLATVKILGASVPANYDQEKWVLIDAHSYRNGKNPKDVSMDKLEKSLEPLGLTITDISRYYYARALEQGRIINLK